MIIEGILSIQAGDNPRIVEEKLKTFLDARRARKLSSEEEGDERGATAARSGRRP